MGKGSGPADVLSPAVARRHGQASTKHPSCPLAEVLLPQLLHTSQPEPSQSPWSGSQHVSPFCPMPRAGSWAMSYGEGSHH